MSGLLSDERLDEIRVIAVERDQQGDSYMLLLLGHIEMRDRLLQEYLDGAITNWRRNRDAATDKTDELIASCYVDAYQSVRTSILGELLGTDAK